MKCLLEENVDVVISGLIKVYANHSVVDTNNVPVGCYRGNQYTNLILGTLLGTDVF